MYITDFSISHIGEASEIAISCYRAERRQVNDLPYEVSVPPLSDFAANGLGVVAVDENHLLGYICALKPWDNAFGNGVRGIFSPVHANAVDRALPQQNRTDIYARLYQAAAEKWVRTGAVSHAIAAYAHDADAVGTLFNLGFGLRCVDAVKLINIKDSIEYQFGSLNLRELDKSELPMLRPLRHALCVHLGESPCFMYSATENFDKWIERAEARDSRLFAATDGERAAAFVEVTDDGENFITETSDMKNICGAYCLPEYRGTGLIQALISFVESKLTGAVRLGVDYESINPTAARFWRKLFVPYTSGLVRRVDESILRRDFNQPC